MRFLHPLHSAIPSLFNSYSVNIVFIWHKGCWDRVMSGIVCLANLYWNLWNVDFSLKNRFGMVEQILMSNIPYMYSSVCKLVNISQFPLFSMVYIPQLQVWSLNRHACISIDMKWNERQRAAEHLNIESLSKTSSQWAMNKPCYIAAVTQLFCWLSTRFIGIDFLNDNYPSAEKDSQNWPSSIMTKPCA